jgi:beta-lactamase class D
MLAISTAHARTLCTAIADASTGRMLQQQGDCDTRVTPASTFKIAISLMGYDAGFLKDAHTPALPFRPGYADWGGAAWRQTTDPTRWIAYSVVWYSQQVTTALGQLRMQHYVDAFRFGNRDLSGDPVKHDGLTHAWIDSSLQISPLEQIAFLQQLVNRTLPVSAHAYAMTEQITQLDPLLNGWEIHGKTGTGFPAHADGTDDTAHGYGWFVGWARRGARTLVFARLVQDDAGPAQPPQPVGLRTRAAFLQELPAILDASTAKD